METLQALIESIVPAIGLGIFGTLAFVGAIFWKNSIFRVIVILVVLGALVLYTPVALLVMAAFVIADTPGGGASFPVGVLVPYLAGIGMLATLVWKLWRDRKRS